MLQMEWSKEAKSVYAVIAKWVAMYYSLSFYYTIQKERKAVGHTFSKVKPLFSDSLKTEVAAAKKSPTCFRNTMIKGCSWNTLPVGVFNESIVVSLLSRCALQLFFLWLVLEFKEPCMHTYLYGILLLILNGRVMEESIRLFICFTIFIPYQ